MPAPSSRPRWRRSTKALFVLLFPPMLTLGCARKSESERPASRREPAASVTPKAGSANPEPAPTSPAAPSPSAHAIEPAVEPNRDASLYDLELDLVDQDGKKSDLDVFRGHPVIVSMFYATCPYACPTLISDIKILDKSLSEKARSAARVLLVSMDPANDSAEKLKELAALHGVDTHRWKFARTSEDEVSELAAVLGIKYRRLANGQFNHSSVITLLDAQGFFRARTEGLARSNEELAKEIDRVLGS